MKKNKSMKTISGNDDVLIAGADFPSFFLNFDIINVLVLPQLILEDTMFLSTQCAFDTDAILGCPPIHFVEYSDSSLSTRFRIALRPPHLVIQLPLFAPQTELLHTQSNLYQRMIPNEYVPQMRFQAFLFYH